MAITEEGSGSALLAFKPLVILASFVAAMEVNSTHTSRPFSLSTLFLPSLVHLAIPPQLGDRVL